MPQPEDLRPHLVRRITINCTEDTVGKVCIRHILTYYRMGLSMVNMIRKLTPMRGQMGVGTAPISFVDIYGVLYQAKKLGSIRQRQSPRDELPIDKFQEFYRLWQGGSKLVDIQSAFAPRYCSVKFIQGIYRSLNRRWREERQLRRTVRQRIDIRTMELQIISAAKRVRIKNRDALVMFLDDLSAAMREELLDRFPLIESPHEFLVSADELIDQIVARETQIDDRFEEDPPLLESTIVQLSTGKDQEYTDALPGALSPLEDLTPPKNI